MGVSIMASTTTKTRKPQPEITSPAIFRIVDKITKQCIGYGVPSDSEPGTIYYVTWNKASHCYTCTCKGGQCANCKHRRAVVQVLAAKKQLAMPQHIANFFAAMATYEQEEIAKQAVAEAEQVVQPPQRYCDACSTASPLQLVDGLQLCSVCAEQTQPASVQTPTTVAPPTRSAKKPLATAKKPPVIATKGNAPLGNNKVFSLTR